MCIRDRYRTVHDSKGFTADKRHGASGSLGNPIDKLEKMCIRDSVQIVRKIISQLMTGKSGNNGFGLPYIMAARGTVSYTHLDVYKRQVYNRIPIYIP